MLATFERDVLSEMRSLKLQEKDILTSPSRMTEVLQMAKGYITIARKDGVNIRTMQTLGLEPGWGDDDDDDE